MLFSAILVLAVTTVILWRRVDALERLLAESAGRAIVPAAEPAVARAASDPLPATPSFSPPAIADRPTPAPEPMAGEPPSGAGSLWDRLPAGRLPRFDIEDLFGRLLPIWAGGVTLAVAGFFLVRWSIDAGLLTPGVRVALAGLFGAGLVAGAEVAYRWREKVADPRVAQALAGAGLATLYAAFYLAGTTYGLIGSTLAFVGLAAVTGAAIALSFRFGLPSAVLGLVGGFAAPALVGGEQASLPLLTLYLALVTAGLAFTGRRQDRAWLGIAALAGGLGWGTLLIAGGASDTPSVIVLGAYLVLLGGILPVFSGGGLRPHRAVRIAAAALAALQLATLVRQGGFGGLEWGFYLMLGGALAWFGWRAPAMREANAVAAAVGVALTAFWPDPQPLLFAFVAAAIAAIFAGVPLAQIWRGHDRRLDFAQVSGVALGMAFTAYLAFGDIAAGRSEPELALATFAVALLPAMAVWLAWPDRDAGHARPALGALACAAALATVSLLLALPAWAAPFAGLPVVAVLGMLDRGRTDDRILAIGRVVAVVGVLLMLGLPQVAALREAELQRLFGIDAAAGAQSALRWLAAALAFVPLAWRERAVEWRRGSEAAVAVLAYGTLAQLLAGEILAWVVAMGTIALAWRFPRAGAIAALGVIAGLWAVPPLAQWSAVNLLALVGEQAAVGDLPTPMVVVRQILPALAVLAFIAWHVPLVKLRRPVLIGLAAVATIVAHIAYRHAFALAAGTDFAATGVIERALWEAVMLVAAWLAYRFGQSRLGLALAIAALAHFAWFALVLHNPLWAYQLVGAWPVANALLSAYASGLAALVLLRRWLPAGPSYLRWATDAATMASIALLVVSELRQAFAGSWLSSVPVGQAEDLLRSLSGIVLAIGFLLWGTRTGGRAWRIGSLVAMVIAVLKVFLVDAADLAGLARIASFMALGFSLIGIGWFYNRQLRAPRAEVSAK